MIKKFQLKNGLQVIFVQTKRAPVVSMQMWVRTGSADEAKGEEGISHFIEHLVFKGSEKYGVGEISSLVEGSGGELNAYTSFDQTVFYITISKNYLNVGLDALLQMMGYPTFDPNEVDSEREVVVEEIKRGQDSLGRKASQLMFSTAYKKHPYGRPVIGYAENVKSWPVARIKKYYNAKYNPQNMFLLLCGDFELDSTKKLLQTTYGLIPKHKTKKSTRKPEAKIKTPRVAVETSSFQQGLSYITWPIPKISHKDIPALDLLSVILGQGDSSRLVRTLRIDSHTANSVGASLFTAQDPGLMAVSLGFNPDKLDACIEKIKEQILLIIEQGVSEDEIKRAMTNLESEQLYSLETVDGVSRQFGNAEFLFRNPKSFDKYLKDLKATTAQMVQKAAHKYLRPENICATAVVPNEKEATETKLKKFIADYKKQFPKTIKSKASKKAKLIKIPKLKFSSSALKIEKEVLSNGVEVLWIPQKDTHVVSARAVLRGGLRNEPTAHSGLVELLGRTWLGGTEKLSEIQIAEMTESLASGINPIVGRNSIGLGLDTLSHMQLESVPLYMEILTQSVFPESVMQREKSVQVEQIKNRKDSPTSIMMRLFHKSLFGNHPYSRDMLGTEQSLAQIEQKHILSYWTKIATRENLKVVVAGNFEKDIWKKSIEQQLSLWGKGSEVRDEFALPKHDKNIFDYEFAQKEQSHMVAGFPSYSIFSPKRYVLEIIQSVLAGQGGRLFLELRDKNSLAYSVSPVRMEGIEGGYFGAYIGCSPEKTQKALQMMRDEFKKLQDSLISDLELERAKKYLIGRHDIDLQRTSSICSSVIYDHIYGLDINRSLDAKSLYSGVTKADIQSVAQELFSRPMVISLVGPENNISE